MSFIQHEALKHYEDMKIMASIMSLMAQEKRLLKWALRVTWCKIPRGFSGRCMAATDGNWIFLLSLHFTTVKRLNHTIEKLPQVFCFRWWEISEFFCTRREWSWFKSKWDFHLLWLTMRNGGKLKPIIHIIAKMAPCVMQCHACTVQYSTVLTSFTTSNDREKLRIMQINTETSLWESIVTVGFRDCETSRRFVPSSNTFPASSGHYFFGCLNLLLNTRHGFMFCINH